MPASCDDPQPAEPAVALATADAHFVVLGLSPQKSTCAQAEEQVPAAHQHISHRERGSATLLFRLAVTPLILLYFAAAFVAAVLCTWCVVPSFILAHRLYWCAPFLPHAFRTRGFPGLRLWFEACYCTNTVRRLLTLPFRPHLPAFYIAGFPKAGTTSLANHLKGHPALGGLAGLRGHDALGKESHYFNGVFGRHHASSALLYRSFFPTILTQWWAEHVHGVEQWKCFDACPVPSCLPYAASRMAAITPDAKIIFVLRDPIDSFFSAEIMLRNFGSPLDCSLMELSGAAEPSSLETPEEAAMWGRLETLGVTDPLPTEMPQMLYGRMSGLLHAVKYGDRLEPFFRHFPKENIMVIDFEDFLANPKQIVSGVLRFVGVDPAAMPHHPLPAGMKTHYRGRKVHPRVRAALQNYLKESNQLLCQLLGRSFSWIDAEL